MPATRCAGSLGGCPPSSVLWFSFHTTAKGIVCILSLVERLGVPQAASRYCCAGVLAALDCDGVAGGLSGVCTISCLGTHRPALR